jgi:protein-S-isoprenylcysteine O-methyltransferase Ste14
MFRWSALVILVAALTVSGSHRRRARAQGETIARTREGAPLIAGRLLVALPLFGGILACIISPTSMEWASIALPLWLRWLGVVLGVLVVFSAHWVLSNLGRNVSETVLTKQDQELVVSGPYRWVRHPLYTTGIGLFIALGLMAANGFILAFALIALAAIRLVVVPLEEKALIERFGPEYRAYMQRTGAMFPRLSRPAEGVS